MLLYRTSERVWKKVDPTCPKTGLSSEVMYREGVHMATRYGIVQPNGVKFTLLYDSEQDKAE